jgi:hypothetical protein
MATEMKEPLLRRRQNSQKKQETACNTSCKVSNLACFLSYNFMNLLAAVCRSWLYDVWEDPSKPCSTLQFVLIGDLNILMNIGLVWLWFFSSRPVPSGMVGTALNRVVNLLLVIVITYDIIAFWSMGWPSSGCSL